MTIQTQFHNWQTAPMVPDPRRCSPLLISWRTYLIDTWGGQDLGCWGQRSVVDGTSPSSHASGAAQDWRYESPGPGRPFMLGTILPWLIDNSLELGLQAIHDYVGCRIWRPPGTSGRPSQPSPDSGWRQQTPGSQMGQSWALWLHLECLNTRWSDTRTVDEMLRSRPDPIPPTPEPPKDDDMSNVLILEDARNGAWYRCDAAVKSWIRDGNMAEQVLMRLDETNANGVAIDGFRYTRVTNANPDFIRSCGPIVGPAPTGVDEYGG